MPVQQNIYEECSKWKYKNTRGFWTATRTLIKVRETDKINGHSYMQKNYSKQVQF